MIHKDLVPEKLTLQWVESHSYIRLIGADHRWIVLVWRNVIFLRISDVWTPEDTDDYINRLSALPNILSGEWDTIFFVFDLTRMKFRVEDTVRYLRANWIKFLDNEDMKVCIVDKSKIRRIALQSLHTLIGKLDKIRIFRDCSEAFKWVHEVIVNSTSATCTTGGNHIKD
jgi:hypothetical protein